jgi:hypothetical protein
MERPMISDFNSRMDQRRGLRAKVGTKMSEIAEIKSVIHSHSNELNQTESVKNNQVISHLNPNSSHFMPTENVSKNGDLIIKEAE